MLEALRSRRPPQSLSLALALALGSTLLLPVVAVEIPELTALTPLIAGGLIVLQLSTAYLLFVRFVDERRLSLLVLGAAFTYSTVMAVSYCLAFPGALSDRSGPAASETTAWIFLAWRLGFAALCFVAVLVEAFAAQILSHLPSAGKAIGFAAIASALSAAAICVLVPYIQTYLPALMDGRSWTGWNKAAGALTLVLLAGALIAIHRLLDANDAIFQWLSMSLVAFFFSYLLSDLGGARLTAGWVIGRLFWLGASAVLFVHFMHQFWLQQQALIAARAALQQQVFDQASKLEQAEVLFDQFMCHLPGLAWIKNSEGRYTYVNEAAERAFGHPRENICGASDYDLFPAATADNFVRNDRKAMAERQGVRVIETLEQPEGVRHSIVSKFPFPAADGSVLIGGMAIDVTDHKLAEEALRDSERRFRELVEGLAEAVVWEGDPETLTYTFVSEAATKLLGYPRERWLDERDFWVTNLHPEDRERAIATCRQETGHGRDHQLEYRMIAADRRTVWLRDRVYISTKGGKPVSRGLLTDITRWKHAEAVLRDSEERFRNMTEHAPVMIWMSDAQGACIHINRMLRNFFNVKNEALSDFNWSDLIHPDDAANVGRQVRSAVAERKPFSVQARYRNAAGEYRILNTEALPRHAASGEFAGMIGVNVDVTDVVRSTEQLRSSEERLTIATAAAALGVFEWDVVADRATFENERMCSIFGHAPDNRHLSKEEFIRAYLHPEDAEAFETTLASALKPGGHFSHVCRIRPKGGSEWRWIEIAGNFKHQSLGAPVVLVGVVADITARKYAEEERLRNAALLEAVSDGTNDLIFVKDRESRLLYANRAALRVIGLPSDQLLGTSGAEWNCDAGEIEIFLANDRHVIATGELITREETFTGADGTRTYLSTKAPMLDNTRSIIGLIGVSRDITERKVGEQHTLMLLREVSHRAKNMLAVAQAMVRRSARDKGTEGYANALSARLAALGACHDLVVTNDWRSVGISDLVLSQLAHLKKHVNHRIFLSGPELQLSPAAAQTLGMALHELATNATKFGALSHSLGRIEIVWRMITDSSQPSFEIEWRESGGPPAAPFKHKGFGYSVVTRMVELGLDAHVSFSIHPSGATWLVNAPSVRVLADVGNNAARRATSDTAAKLRT